MDLIPGSWTQCHDDIHAQTYTRVNHNSVLPMPPLALSSPHVIVPSLHQTVSIL